MNDNEQKFEYVYSAPTERERREIENIKKQYTTKPKRVNKRGTKPPLTARHNEQNENN